METNWLWDKSVTEEQAKALLADAKHPQFIAYAALLLSRTNSAKEVFHNFLSRENFFVSWTRIKKQMRKDSWNDPRIDYWQAIYDTLKELPELGELKVPRFQEPSVSPIPREIGANIKMFREQYGLTQKDLAKKLKISQQIISRIESGRQNVSSKTAHKISEALGISSEKLYSKNVPGQTILLDQNILLFPKDAGEFEEFCLEVIIKSKEYSEAGLCGGVGDRGVDIAAFRNLVGKREKWYFQCKRHQSFDINKSREDLQKIKKHSDDDPAFKPDGIIFIVACPVTPGSKTKIKEYAGSLGFDPDKVFVWDGRELKTRAMSAGVEMPLPATKKDVEKAAKDGSNDTVRQIVGLIQQAGLLPEREGSKNKGVNDEIDEAVQFVHLNNIEKAKQELFKILGKIKNEPQKYKEELVRVYNALGVCFNRFEIDGGDFDAAEKYFHLALDLDSNFVKAKMNLAAAYLNKGGEKNYKKAFEITSFLWEASDKKDPVCFQEFIWAKFHYQSPEDAIAYYESSAESQTLVQQNEQLLNLMGTIYLGREDYKTAEGLADKALALASDSSPNLMLKARVLMLRAQTEKMERSLFEVIPKFADYEDIEKARELLERALDLTKKDKNVFLANQIRYDLNMCLLWLRHPDFTKVIDEIDKERLGSVERRQSEINGILWQIHHRNFETAYNELVKSPDWPNLSYGEKARMAHIFLLYGAPEQSKDIFKTIETEAEQKRDVQFWIDMSLNEILLGNKNPAIHAGQKAKEFSQGTSKEKMVLSHVGALNLRYARDNEVDRLMTGLSEYDRKYPEDKILRPMKVIDEKGQLSEDFKSVLQAQKDWFEGIKSAFQARPIPSYWLEKMLGRPYAEILSFRGPDEVDFTIELNVPNESFENELLNNLNRAEHLVFDYASLLNISKMNLLGHLEKFGKRFSISRDLFNKVQSELLMFEHEDIRNLWRFLRSSKEVEIVDNVYSVRKEGKYADLFDGWLNHSMRIAKEKSAAFVVDDLRLAKFFRAEEKLNVCNSFIVLRSMLSRGWIDAKMYSTSLGDLAERFYIFLPFSGDDLFQIVMEDKSKVTLRSYHLVNQMFLSGSNADSFTNVFVRFLDLLWKTGSLAEDKAVWLHFLAENVLKLLEQQGGVQDNKELDGVVPHFVQMWIIAVQRSNRDEILLLEKRVDKIFEAPVYNVFKDNVVRFIKTKKTSLGLV